MKDIVYVPSLPASLPELRARMYVVAEQVSPAMLQRVWEEIDYRWDTCSITNGSRIEHLQFKNTVIWHLIPNVFHDCEKTLFSLNEELDAKYYHPLVELCKSQEVEEIDVMIKRVLDQEKTFKEKIKKLQSDIESCNLTIIDNNKESNILKDRISEDAKMFERNDLVKRENDELAVLCDKITVLKEEISCKEEQLLHDYKQFKKGISMYNEYLQCYIIPHREDEFIITFNPPKKSATHSPCHVKFKITHSATSFQFVEMQPKLKSEQLMVNQLNETGDIQRFMFNFRNASKHFKISN